MDESKFQHTSSDGVTPSLFSMPSLSASPQPPAYGYGLPFSSMLPPSLSGFTSSLGSFGANTNLTKGNDDLMLQLKQSFESRSAELQSMVEKANESVKAANSQRDAAISRADKAEIDAKGQQARLATLQLEVETSQRSVQQHSAAVASAATQLEQVSNEAASTKAELKRYFMEMEASRRELQQQASTNRSLMAQVDSSAKALASVKAEFSSFKVQSDIQAETSRTTQELAKQTIANLTEEVSRSTTSLHQTRSAHEASKLDVERTNAQLRQLQGENDALKAAAAQEADKNVRMLQSMQEEMRRSESERKRLQESLGMYQHELEMTKRALGEFERRLRELGSPAGWLKGIF